MYPRLLILLWRIFPQDLQPPFLVPLLCRRMSRSRYPKYDEYLSRYHGYCTEEFLRWSDSLKNSRTHSTPFSASNAPERNIIYVPLLPMLSALHPVLSTLQINSTIGNTIIFRQNAPKKILTLLAIIHYHQHQHYHLCIQTKHRFPCYRAIQVLKKRVVLYQTSSSDMFFFCLFLFILV